jgi:hypothetical protein
MYATINSIQFLQSTATMLYINNINVIPGENISVQWWLRSNDGISLNNGVINITGSDYIDWNTSNNHDEFIYYHVATKINVVIQQILNSPMPPLFEPQQ